MQQHLEILDASRCVEPPPTIMQHIRMMKRSQSTPMCLTTSLRSATETGAGPNNGLSIVWPLVVSFPFVFLFDNLLTFFYLDTTNDDDYEDHHSTTWQHERAQMTVLSVVWAPYVFFLFVFLFDDIVLTFFLYRFGFFPSKP